MSETPQQTESRNRREFSYKDHQEFVGNRSRSLAKKAGEVLAWGFMIPGTVFALVGIGDFFTGGEVSKALMQVNPETVPEFVVWIDQHLALMPDLAKTAGGSSMIATGQRILNWASKK